MGQTKFLVQKILGWKIFADLKNLGSKEILIKKSFESNKFLVKNMFGPKIEVHNFWVKKVWVKQISPQNVGPKKILIQKDFGQK